MLVFGGGHFQVWGPGDLERSLSLPLVLGREIFQGFVSLCFQLFVHFQEVAVQPIGVYQDLV